MVALDDGLDDREAQTGAARGIARDAVKALEHAVALGRRNPAASIDDAQLDHFLDPAHGHGDEAAGGA